MIKNLIKVFAFSAIALVSCKKDDVNPNTGVPSSKGRLKLVNNSNNPYYIVINGANKGQVAGNKFRNDDVNPGSYNIKVEQVSGYILYPTKREFNTSVSAGQEIVVSFP